VRSGDGRSPRRGDAASLPSTRPCTLGNGREERPTGRYEIRIKGRVSEQTASAFEGLALDVRPVETVLHGDIADEARLHALLDRVLALGLELIEVRRLPPADGDASSGSRA
jgi:hypothetical protein